jgi:dienelactone hydrolase
MFRLLRDAALAFALVSGVPAAASPAEGAPTAAELAATPLFADPALSPDGRSLAIEGLRAGEPRLRIVDLADPGRASRAAPLPDDAELRWFRWIGNARLLIGFEEPDSAASGMAVVDLTTGRRTPIARLGGETRVIHVDRAGAFLLASAQASEAETPSVYRVDLTSGAATRVVDPRPDVWDWYADSAGVVRAGMGVKGGRSWLLYRSGEGDAFRQSERGAGDLDSGIERFVPVRGSDQGYALARSPAGRVALYRYDFEASRLGALVYENPAVDIEGYQTGPDGALLGVEYVDDRDEVRWFDSQLAALQAKLDKALPGRANRIVSMSDDRARLVVFSRSPTEPGTYYLSDSASGRLERLLDINPAVAGKPLSAMRPVRYAARDGLEIRAYLTLPEGREARGLPLIVLPHGGPFARDDWGYDPWVQYLASKGYAVLQPNYRGSTGFGQKFVARGDGEWGRGMQDDLDDGVRWLAGRGTIDAARTCIMGASYGGYAAMWAAVREGQPYRCAISFAGISDVAAQLEHDRKSFAPRFFKQWKARIQGDAASLDALSPVRFAEHARIPLLIAHGGEDDTVPPDQATGMRDALERLGREPVYLAYPEEGHDLEDSANIADFLEHVGAFLDAHNPA